MLVSKFVFVKLSQTDFPLSLDDGIL